MKKRFNTTGACFPDRHYMVDMAEKVEQTMKMVNRGAYFVIHRPRQYAKTTLLGILENRIESEGKIAIFISFQNLGNESFESERHFCDSFIELIGNSIAGRHRELSNWVLQEKEKIHGLSDLSRFISRLTDHVAKEIVLLIDEVDKSGDHFLFIDFLGMLRAKFLEANRNSTFSSVILSGLYDIKNLKSKLRPDSETQYNSPWNIATEFKVEMRFSPKEIESMLRDYVESEKVSIDIPAFAERIYFYTSGYPYLVSRLCQIMDEEMPGHKNEWTEEILEQAVFLILKEENTNFDNIFQKLENNPALYDLCYQLLVEGQPFTYNYYHPTMQLGILYGIFRKNGTLQIHNRIYEQFIYNYLNSKLESQLRIRSISDSYINEKGELVLEKVIDRFKEFMRAEQGKKDKAFLERDARLVFLAFLTPILNGKGYTFREVQIAEEKRLDVVIVFGKQRFIVELKIWRDEAYHAKGLEQLADYMTSQQEDTGYLLVFNCGEEQRNKGKEQILLGNKKIRLAWI